MMDKDYLYQIDIREWIERGLDADIMVPVSGNKIDKKYDISMLQLLITTAHPKQQSSFLPRCRTRCIMQFTDIRQQS